MSSDPDLINLDKIKNGSQEAFESLFFKYFPKVKYFIAHLVKSDEVSEELAQDIFIKIWLYRDNLSHVQQVNSYIYRMAKNAALNYLKSTYKDVVEFQDYLKNDEQASVEDEYFAKETELLVKLTVSKMPPQRQTIYLMSREGSLKNEEIAVQLNLSKKTVENHINLALKEIKRAIGSVSIFLV